MSKGRKVWGIYIDCSINASFPRFRRHWSIDELLEFMESWGFAVSFVHLPAMEIDLNIQGGPNKVMTKWSKNRIKACQWD